VGGEKKEIGEARGVEREVAEKRISFGTKKPETRGGGWGRGGGLTTRGKRRRDVITHPRLKRPRSTKKVGWGDNITGGSNRQNRKRECKKKKLENREPKGTPSVFHEGSKAKKSGSSPLSPTKKSGAKTRKKPQRVKPEKE